MFSPVGNMDMEMINVDVEIHGAKYTPAVPELHEALRSFYRHARSIRPPLPPTEIALLLDGNLVE